MSNMITASTSGRKRTPSVLSVVNSPSSSTTSDPVSQSSTPNTPTTAVGGSLSPQQQVAPSTTKRPKLSNTCLSIRCIQLTQHKELFEKKWNECFKDLRHESLCPCVGLIPSQNDINVHYLCTAQQKSTCYDEMIHWRKTGKRVSDARVYQVCSQALNALHVLHMHGIYLGKLFSAKNIYLDTETNTNLKIGDFAFLHYCNMIRQMHGHDSVCPASDFAVMGKILLQYICGPKPLIFVPNVDNQGQTPQYSSQQLTRIQRLDPSIIEILTACVQFEITDSRIVYESFSFFDTVAPIRSAYLDFKYVRVPHLKCVESDESMNPPNLKQRKHEDLSAMRQFISNREEFCLFAKKFFMIEPNVFSMASISDLQSKELYFPAVHMKQVLIPSNLLQKSTNLVETIQPKEEITRYSNLKTLRGLTRRSAAEQPDYIRKLFPNTQENTLNYQVAKIRVFRQHIMNYPASKIEIFKLAKENIPPTLRAEIWSCLLDCPALNIMIKEWERLQEEMKTADRDQVLEKQIEVDIIRCHQYHHLMKTQAAKDAVSLVLHNWVRIHLDKYKSNLLKGGVYWQGIDSICAVFVVLNGVFQTKNSIQVDNSTNLARSIFCLDLFINKFLDGYFVHMGHEGRMQRDLTILGKLVNWIDSEIGGHLELLGFDPELYAISWLLTCYAHVLPMEKILLLWDVILVSSPEMILFIAVAMIRQLKSELLHCDFNTAMVQFQNLQNLDIRKAVSEARTISEKTPKSFIEMPFVSDNSQTHLARKEEKITISEYRSYITARICAQDFEKTYAKLAVVLDIRPLNMYKKCHLHIGTSIFLFADQELTISRDKLPENAEQHNEMDLFNEELFFSKLKYKVGLPIVLIDESDEYSPFCKRIEKLLIMERIPYVCAVFGGFRAIRNKTNLEVVFAE